jgi:hypothetical protein
MTPGDEKYLAWLASDGARHLAPIERVSVRNALAEIRRLRVMYEPPGPPPPPQVGGMPVAVSRPGAYLLAELDRVTAACAALQRHRCAHATTAHDQPCDLVAGLVEDVESLRDVLECVADDYGWHPRVCGADCVPCTVRLVLEETKPGDGGA